MAKLELIDRGALVAELENVKASMGDPVLQLVVARVIERVKAQPVLMVAHKGCINCKYRDLGVGTVPCSECLLSRRQSKWESIHENL